jgi:hypothetical protein
MPTREKGRGSETGVVVVGKRETLAPLFLAFSFPGARAPPCACVRGRAAAAHAHTHHGRRRRRRPRRPPPRDGSPDLHIATSSYRLSVSNAAGYLCRITCEATFPVPPATLFRVLTNERNTGVFRDIKDVASRTVLSEGGGVRVVEVEQVRERGGGVEGRERGGPIVCDEFHPLLAEGS